MVINTLQYDVRYTQCHTNTLQYDVRYTQRHINTLQYDARYTQCHINTLQYDARYTQRHINTLQYDARYTQRQNINAKFCWNLFYASGENSFWQMAIIYELNINFIPCAKNIQKTRLLYVFIPARYQRHHWISHHVSFSQIVKCVHLWAVVWQEELVLLPTTTTNVSVFRDVISCSLVQKYSSFARHYYLHLQT